MSTILSNLNTKITRIKAIHWSRLLAACCILCIIIIAHLGCAARVAREARGVIPADTAATATTTGGGEDLKAIHLSYRTLIKNHFNGLRQHALATMKHTWAPGFIKDSMKKGQLVERTQGTSPTEIQQKVEEWVLQVVEEIEEKRHSLLKAIDDDEQKLLRLVDRTFARLIKNSRARNALNTSLNIPSKRKRSSKPDKPDNPTQQSGQPTPGLTTAQLNRMLNKINAELAAASARAADNLKQLTAPS